MTFFERYEKLCLANGYKPGSEQAAQALGTNRGTISAWKTSGKPPKTEYLVVIADTYGVSTDYLLGRTDDPTDYSKPELIATLTGKQLEEFDGDVKKALALQRAVAEDVQREKRATREKGEALYSQLDSLDKGKAEGFMQGLLSQDKYIPQLDNRKKRA
jgi:transcriptional regulator with XRE-family HTH domain